MILLYSLLILIFPLIIFLNIFFYRIMVGNALRRFIKPNLNAKGLVFVEYKWPGLLSSGNFKDDTPELRIASKNGRSTNSIYAYIYYSDLRYTKKITVRINTKFLTINNVDYSSGF